MAGFVPANQHHRFHFVKSAESYPAANQIQKDSRVTFDIPGHPNQNIKFGLKLLRTQGIMALILNPTSHPVDLWNNYRDAGVTNELNTAFQAVTLPSETWEGFGLPVNYVPAIPFDTRLIVQNFTVLMPNFQVVPWVFTYNTIAFSTGHYLVGASVLVGP